MRTTFIAASAVLPLLLPLQAALAQPAQDQGSSELVRQCKVAQRDAKIINNAKDLFDSGIRKR
jgi:hypothetical protein